MIKNLSVTILFLMIGFVNTAFAEESMRDIFKNKNDDDPQTLFSMEEVSFSGFGGPVLTIGKIGDNYSVFTGGKGAAIISNTVLIGGGGYGMVTPTKRQDITGIRYTGTDKYVAFGYGGGLLGMNLLQKKLINFSAYSIIGGGGLDTYSNSTGDAGSGNSDACFVLEPTLQTNVNMARWFRLGLGVSYRKVYGLNSSQLSNDAFSGLNGVVSAEFGWF